MRIRRWLWGAAALIALMGAEPLDEGEFHCEEAVKHLEDCCPGFNTYLVSCVAGRGCDNTRPDIDDPLATQVRDESCDELRAAGACEAPPKSPKPANESQP
jgi:hypothetical protein